VLVWVAFVHWDRGRGRGQLRALLCGADEDDADYWGQEDVDELMPM
jgi:hypothetical protein